MNESKQFKIYKKLIFNKKKKLFRNTGSPVFLNVP